MESVYSKRAVALSRVGAGRGRGRGARIAPEPEGEQEDRRPEAPHVAEEGRRRDQRGLAASTPARAAIAAELGRQAWEEIFASVTTVARPGTAKPGLPPRSPQRRPHEQQQQPSPPPPAALQQQQDDERQQPHAGGSRPSFPSLPAATSGDSSGADVGCPSSAGEEAAAGPSGGGADLFLPSTGEVVAAEPSSGSADPRPPCAGEMAAAEPSREGGMHTAAVGAGCLSEPPADRPQSAPTTSRPTGRVTMPPQSLYERLKHLRPAEQREELEEQEAYWDGDEDLQERRHELQRRQQDEQMLERIKRRVAGEKVEVPRVLQRMNPYRGTPRAAGSDSSRSQQSTPASGGARRLLSGGDGSSQSGTAGRRTSALQNSSSGDNGVAGREVPGLEPGAWAGWWPKVQHAAQLLTSQPDFQFIVMLIILLNCTVLAMYRPSMPADSSWNRALQDLDIAITVLFTVEMVLMMVAEGGPVEYLRGSWNVFDFLMVLAGYTTFIPASSSSTASSASAVRALRALRALRPLRTITRFESLRSIVVCFLEAVPMLASVVGLLYFFILLFAIAATVLFLDAAYYSCVDSTTGEMLMETEYNMHPPLQTAGFGNIGLSLLSMFQVTTLTDWTYQLYLVMDRAGPFPLIFYIFYILLQCYFVVNLFLAVLKHRFATATTLYSKVVTSHGKPRSTLALAWQALCAALRRRMDTQRSVFEERMSQLSSRASSQCSSRAGAGSPGLLITWPATSSSGAILPPPSGLRAKVGEYWFEFRWRVRQVVDHPAFTWTFMLLILANTILLAMVTAGMSDAKRRRLDAASMVFTFLFTAECCVKLLGYGFAGFFSDGMNLFDAVVVVLSLVDTFASVILKMLGLGASGFFSDAFNAFDLLVVALGVLEMALAMGANGNAMRSFRTLRILRSFRVLRVLKIFCYLDSLRVISEVMMGSMTQFFAVALLMVLFIFVFALIGLQVFGQQSEQFDPPLPSFLGFWNSFILVFQVLTLEAWPDTMFKVQAAAGWPSVLFFVAWVTVGKWIILTLFLAITLAAFEQSYGTVTRTTTGGSLSRAFSTLASLPDRLTSCCCRCWPWRRAEQQQVAGVVGRAELWKQAAVAKSASGCDTSGENDAPPPLNDAAAKEAAAALSAAMSSKLGGTAHPFKDAAVGVNAGVLSQGIGGGLIKAAPAPAANASASSPQGASSEGQQQQQQQERQAQPALSRVSSVVQHFESLTASKPGSHCSMDTLPEDGESQQQQQPCDGNTLASKPKRQGRHARFADTPEEDENETLTSPAAAVASPAVKSTCSDRSPTPFPVGKHLFSSSPLGRNSPAGLSTSSSQHQVQPAGPRQQHSDQSLAAELQDAASCSQFSGISGASSVSSHFSRLAGHARRRSRRKDYPPLRGTSLRFFKVDNPVRGFLYNLVTMQAVDYFLVLVVLLSCVEMAMETPKMDPAARKTQVLHWIDVSTTIVFGLEAVLKVLAFGFRPYLSFNTNKLDLLVVSVSVAVLIAESANARFIKVLRVLRAVRPLRMLTRSQSMLMVFHTLIRSLAAMGNVTVLAGLVFLIFAILGVQLFAGLLWSCNDGSVAGKDECVGMYLDPATGSLQSREWTNQWLNFDNIGNALLTLFITSTLDGYTSTMYMTMATRSMPGMQPKPGSNPASFLFWFAFITLCSFFVLNLYIGVVFFQYQRLKSLSETGSAVLTATQTGHVEMLRAVFRLKPLDVAPLPDNRVRRWCYLIAHNRWFDRFMLCTIVLNILLTATTFYNAPPGFVHGQENINTVFSALVILELVVKLTAMGRLYWRSNWNKLDMALSLAALIDIVTQVVNAAASTEVQLGAFKKIMMLARVLRMFRLLRHSKGIQMLLSTLIISLPAIVNVGALLFLLFFIFAYLGVMLFGEIMWQEDLNEHANFSTFPRALLLLFRVATGDNWAALLQDCMVQPPVCDLEEGNCGQAWAPAYFFVFYLAGSMIALNLLVTVQLETFEKIQEAGGWALTPQHLEDFVELWAEYDDGSNSIDPIDMEKLLRRLPPPMGLGPKATDSDVLRFVFSLDIPLDDRGMAPFHRTAYELVVRCTEAEIPEGELKRRLDRMIRRFLNRHAPKHGEREHMNVQVALTVMRIQRHWRATVARRKAERQAARPVVPPLQLHNLTGRPR